MADIFAEIESMDKNLDKVAPLIRAIRKN